MALSTAEINWNRESKYPVLTQWIKKRIKTGGKKSGFYPFIVLVTKKEQRFFELLIVQIEYTNQSKKLVLGLKTN